jgi:hypothetical protein
MTVDQIRIPLQSTGNSSREAPPWLLLRTAGDRTPGEAPASVAPPESEPAPALTSWPRVFPGL